MVAPAEGAASLDSSVSLPLKPAPRGLGSRQRLRMSPIGTDDFWEDLLDFIEQGKVIPVIGEHAVSFGEGNEPLYPFLARELDSAWCKRRTARRDAHAQLTSSSSFA